jgi:hypothetical protein
VKLVKSLVSPNIIISRVIVENICMCETYNNMISAHEWCDVYVETRNYYSLLQLYDIILIV